MPAYSLTSTLTDPSGDLTADTKYVVQNQGGAPIFFAVGTAAFTDPPTTGFLVLGPVGPATNIPSHLEYTYAATDFVRVWANDTTDPPMVIFHAIG